jgi:hypothetical protein
LRPIKRLSSALPVGLTNDCDDSKLHRIFGDLRNLIKADESSDYCKSFAPTYFAGFNVNTNLQARKQVLDVLKKMEKPNKVIYAEMNYDQSHLLSYLRKLRSVPFVICPEGNGVDTHRLWETLYMGGIPVIKHNTLLTEILADLPVITLSAWEKLNDLEYMHSCWTKIHQSVWDFKKLSLSFWNNSIVVK